MILSDVCFTDNDFIGSGVVVVEGSIDDLTSSNVFGTVDPALKCPYASIGLVSCVDYDSDTCSASNTFDGMDPPVPINAPITYAPAYVAVAAAAPTVIEDKKSGCFPIQSQISFVLLLVSVVLAL